MHVAVTPTGSTPPSWAASPSRPSPNACCGAWRTALRTVPRSSSSPRNGPPGSTWWNRPAGRTPTAPDHSSPTTHRCATPHRRRGVRLPAHRQPRPDRAAPRQTQRTADATSEDPCRRSRKAARLPRRTPHRRTTARLAARPCRTPRLPHPRGPHRLRHRPGNLCPGRACRRAGARSLPHRPGDPALRQEQERPRITFSCATFQGRIRVTDPEALRAALLGGVGPSKGYGQGLLTLGPLPPEAPHA